MKFTQKVVGGMLGVLVALVSLESPAQALTETVKPGDAIALDGGREGGVSTYTVENNADEDAEFNILQNGVMTSYTLNLRSFQPFNLPVGVDAIVTNTGSVDIILRIPDPAAWAPVPTPRRMQVEYIQPDDEVTFDAAYDLYVPGETGLNLMITGNMNEEAAFCILLGNVDDDLDDDDRPCKSDYELYEIEPGRFFSFDIPLRERAVVENIGNIEITVIY